MSLRKRSNVFHTRAKLLKRHFPWCAGFEEELRRLFEAYVEAKQNQHVLDYDDLLLYWAELMKAPELAKTLRHKQSCCRSKRSNIKKE
jgi:superfamily I DNA/RNA helicase